MLPTLAKSTRDNVDCDCVRYTLQKPTSHRDLGNLIRQSKKTPQDRSEIAALVRDRVRFVSLDPIDQSTDRFVLDSEEYGVGQERIQSEIAVTFADVIAHSRSIGIPNPAPIPREIYVVNSLANIYHFNGLCEIPVILFDGHHISTITSGWTRQSEMTIAHEESHLQQYMMGGLAGLIGNSLASSSVNLSHLEAISQSLALSYAYSGYRYEPSFITLIQSNALMNADGSLMRLVDNIFGHPEHRRGYEFVDIMLTFNNNDLDDTARLFATKTLTEIKEHLAFLISNGNKRGLLTELLDAKLEGRRRLLNVTN